MAYPTVYRNTTDQALTSYNYLDMISGKAYIKFYCLNTDTTRTYFLTQNAIESYKVINTGGGTATGSYVLMADHDYDLKFTRATIIEGTAYAKVLFGHARGSGSSTHTSYVIIKLRRYSGSTETELVSQQSQTLSSGGTTQGQFTGSFIIPRTKFRRGDIFRLTIELWESGGNAESFNWFYAADPLGRAIPAAESTQWTLTADQSTSLIIQIPFNPLR
jgi:hypothetical protein